MIRKLLSLLALCLLAACLPVTAQSAQAASAKDPNFIGTAGTPKILLAGDSITFNNHDSFHDVLDPTYQSRVFGWVGFTAIRYDADLGPSLQTTKIPDRVVVNLGTNDAHVPTDEAATLAALASFYNRFSGKCIVGVTVNTHMAPAAHRDVTVINHINTWITAHATVVADWDALATGHQTDWFTTDHLLVHPDATGQAALSNLILTSLNACP